MLLRFILFIVFLWAIYRLWRRFTLMKHTINTLHAAPNAEPMTKCAYCDLHIPEKQSIKTMQHAFCCEDHRREFVSTHDQY